ncbi:hypothetical protein KIV56_03030 [Cryobacterium breve]|uniref:DUF4190 domain-containing protein n=1 Tax=Cryobacterium breve TaxID=1259258 RepID=A0ABY7NFT5_9MICO|nr:hypothetical protein [Cryobacterium breve]WBM80465.1 hypothetical protein KIV56_03030 [Cryobacterium breve]
MTSVATTTATPGKILGIVGFILAFIPYLQLPGLIVSIIGFNQAKKADAPRGPRQGRHHPERCLPRALRGHPCRHLLGGGRQPDAQRLGTRLNASRSPSGPGLQGERDVFHVRRPGPRRASEILLAL